MVLGGDLPVLPRFLYHGLCASLTHWVGREELSETPCRETVRGAGMRSAGAKGTGAGDCL